uniref:Uncharacterized protein n=1 Tax=Romanomermis culicivorax TaxID=13658 RepID=A0A915J5S5_ROMCU
MWCYGCQRHCGYWDRTLLDERLSLLLMEIFVPSGWTRSCSTVNCHHRQWTPSTGLWNNPQQLLLCHHQLRRQEPKHWRRLPSSN